MRSTRLLSAAALSLALIIATAVHAQDFHDGDRSNHERYEHRFDNGYGDRFDHHEFEERREAYLRQRYFEERREAESRWRFEHRSGNRWRFEHRPESRFENRFEGRSERHYDEDRFYGGR